MRTSGRTVSTPRPATIIRINNVCGVITRTKITRHDSQRRSLGVCFDYGHDGLSSCSFSSQTCNVYSNCLSMNLT